MEMPKKTTKPQPKKTGRKFLSSVRPEKSFWINNGPIVNNIRNLPKALEQVSEDTFTHHVNGEKNDFYNWITEVIGDQKLARRIKAVRSKQDFIKELKNRISELEST